MPRRRLALGARLVAASLAVLLPRESAAASFPCDRAVSARERLICGNAALSQVDARLALSYRAALAAVSEEGRAAFRQSEQQWLRFIDTVCSIEHPPASDAQRLLTGADCLRSEYAARQRQLAGAVTRRGGLVIRRVDLFEAVPAAADQGSGGAHPGFSLTVIAYPQIDRPRGAEETRWNQLMSRWVEDATNNDGGSSNDSGHDVIVDYSLGAVTPELISVMRDTYDDWHGAHGSAADRGITWLIRQGRALQPEDLFDPHRRWRAALARQVFDRAQREERREHRPFGIPPAAELESKVSDPARWLLGRRSLRVRVDPRDLGYDNP